MLEVAPTPQGCSCLVLRVWKRHARARGVGKIRTGHPGGPRSHDNHVGIFCAAETDPAHMGKIPTPPSPGTDGIWRGYFGLATSILVPVPDKAIQNVIAAEVSRRSEDARRLRAEAEAGWEGAKGWFEEELLGADNATQEESKGPSTSQTHAGPD